jgi:hypothetical protein
VADVILVEDTPTDAALAAIAIALRRPRARVREARSLDEALRLLADGAGPHVAILGFRALKEAGAWPDGAAHRVVGFAAYLTQADRRRALESGVRAIYDRPQEWRPFCDALEKLLDDWLK